MTRLAFWLSTIAVGIAAGFGLGRWTCRKPDPAPAVRAADHVVRVADAARVRVDTVYVPQRAAAAAAKAQYDTTTDTVVVTRDTGRVVYVEKAAADHAINACTLALHTCDQVRAADSVEIAALRGAISARDAAVPSRLHLSAAALYDPLARAPSARAEADVGITKHLSAIADAERGVSLTDSLRVHVGARWTF